MPQNKFSIPNLTQSKHLGNNVNCYFMKASKIQNLMKFYHYKNCWVQIENDLILFQLETN